MKMIQIAAACLLLLAGVAIAQESAKPTKTSPKSNASALEAKVRKFWEDYKNKDKASVGATLADGFREFEEGQSSISDKKAELASLDEYELLSYTLKDFTVKPLGSNAALVTYSAQYEGKSGGEVAKGNSIFGEVWIQQGNDWKSLYVQETYVK